MVGVQGWVGVVGSRGWVGRGWLVQGWVGRGWWGPGMDG